jgi:hypothetical protein
MKKHREHFKASKSITSEKREDYAQQPENRKFGKKKQETSRSELVRARMSASASLSKRKTRKRALRILNQADCYAADKRKF